MSRCTPCKMRDHDNCARRVYGASARCTCSCRKSEHRMPTVPALAPPDPRPSDIAPNSAGADALPAACLGCDRRVFLFVSRGWSDSADMWALHRCAS